MLAARAVGPTRHADERAIGAAAAAAAAFALSADGQGHGTIYTKEGGREGRKEGGNDRTNDGDNDDDDDEAAHPDRLARLERRLDGRGRADECEGGGGVGAAGAGVIAPKDRLTRGPMSIHHHTTDSSIARVGMG